jgi:hypothetical protein
LDRIAPLFGRHRRIFMSFHRFARALSAAALAVALSGPAQAQAYDQVVDETPTAEAMTFDLFIMRPLSLAGTLVGTVVYVVALPVNLITLNLADPARRLIVEPAKYTFVRDLGDLD